MSGSGMSEIGMPGVDISGIGTSLGSTISGGSRGDPGVRANPPLDPM